MTMTAKKRTRGPVTLVDKSLVTEEARERIRKEAQDKIAAERMAAAEDALREEMLAEERAKFDPKEERVTITIDIPAIENRILWDGVAYYHGETYDVTRSMAASLREQMGHMWTLEKVSGNPNLSHYKPVRADDNIPAHIVSGFARV